MSVLMWKILLKFILGVRPCNPIGCMFDWYSEDCRFHTLVRHYYFAEFDHEVFFMIIFFLSLFQLRQLSVTGGRMCIEYRLTVFLFVFF